MTVRLKTLATVSVTLVAMFAAMHFGGYRILIRSFHEIETRDTLKNIQRVTDALDNEIDTMAVIAADWGPWDDTYEFVLQPNAAYRAENFGDESLANLGNDLMVYAQVSGRITWGDRF